MEFRFKCGKCEKKAKVLGPIGQTPDTPPRCDCGGTFVRVFQPLGTRFRTSGFYQTDKALYEPSEGYDDDP
jgi:predicted nucleic acid-binding Zn ribbon protein